MASELPVVELPRSLARSLYAGHPWVYKEHLPPRFTAENGSFVRVRAGGFSGYALYDASSPLALRIFSRVKMPDAAWVKERVAAALALRAETGVSNVASAYRWVAGEGDGIPGVIVDRYAGVAVVSVDAEALERLVPWVVEGLREVTPLTGVVRRRKSARGEEKLEVLWGRPPPRDLVVEEHGVRFRANLYEGQKTGLFLDQRDNRNFVRSISAGRRVLNLFGYTGGFSVYAALGGATAVTTVDVAEAAVRDAEENFRLNGLSPDAHEFVAADVFEYLRAAAERRTTFDVVVCDPPSFARNRAQRDAAIEAYARLHEAAIAVIDPASGVYCSSSCTTQVGVDAFRGTVAAGASKAGRALRVFHDAGHAADHPIAVGHPEGRYLKFIVARVSKPA